MDIAAVNHIRICADLLYNRKVVIVCRKNETYRTKSFVPMLPNPNIISHPVYIQVIIGR